MQGGYRIQCSLPSVETTCKMTRASDKDEVNSARAVSARSSTKDEEGQTEHDKVNQPQGAPVTISPSSSPRDPLCPFQMRSPGLPSVLSQGSSSSSSSSSPTFVFFALQSFPLSFLPPCAWSSIVSPPSLRSFFFVIAAGQELWCALSLHPLRGASSSAPVRSLVPLSKNRVIQAWVNVILLQGKPQECSASQTPP